MRIMCTFDLNETIPLELLCAYASVVERSRYLSRIVAKLHLAREKKRATKRSSNR